LTVICDVYLLTNLRERSDQSAMYRNEYVIIYGLFYCMYKCEFHRN